MKLKKADTELQVQKKQELEKFIFVGTIKPKPGQRVYRMDMTKLTVTECEYSEKSDTVNYMDVIDGTHASRERTIIIQEGYDYMIKLNLDNALESFKKRWRGQEIQLGEMVTNDQFKKQRKVNLYSN